MQYHFLSIICFFKGYYQFRRLPGKKITKDLDAYQNGQIYQLVIDEDDFLDEIQITDTGTSIYSIKHNFSGISFKNLRQENFISEQSFRKMEIPSWHQDFYSDIRTREFRTGSTLYLYGQKHNDALEVEYVADSTKELIIVVKGKYNHVNWYFMGVFIELILLCSGYLSRRSIENKP